MLASITLFIVYGPFQINETIIMISKYGFTVAFGLLPILTIMKIVSAVFLSGLKGQSVSHLEQVHMFYSLVLTKEAKKEWADYIEKEKKKASSQS